MNGVTSDVKYHQCVQRRPKVNSWEILLKSTILETIEEFNVLEQLFKIEISKDQIWLISYIVLFSKKHIFFSNSKDYSNIQLELGTSSVITSPSLQSMTYCLSTPSRDNWSTTYFVEFKFFVMCFEILESSLAINMLSPYKVRWFTKKYNG